MYNYYGSSFYDSVSKFFLSLYVLAVVMWRESVKSKRVN